ncbi:putative aryl-alcohol dehydrogenase Aad16p [Trichomonascus vanleenenianus]|uniref:putative aryl-alcohol dehydrogenase Aad16p n=1 Tax=Trichomonascus vanleenenianus TaxID=2268995 RepID=UPI003ECACB1A
MSTSPNSVVPADEYRFLGRTGLRVSSLSLGGWITMGGSNQIEEEKAIAIFEKAYSLGVNFFDAAEVYGNGDCELLMGRIFKKLGWKRSEYVVSTKLFWGGKDVNSRGLSRKHLLEGMTESLDRLQLDYVDLVFAHRPDRSTPMEEIVRGFNQLIQDGKALYWGTSMWTAYEIEHAHHIATKLNLIPPAFDQPLYNMLERDIVEKELAPLFKEYSYGITNFSPLATGLLSGKYTKGTPSESRYASDKVSKDPVLQRIYKERFQGPKAEANFARITKIQQIADDLKVDMAPLALAWCLKNKNISTVITGASKPEQVENNLKAYEVLPLLTDEVIQRIEEALDNKPAAADTYGRL